MIGVAADCFINKSIIKMKDRKNIVEFTWLISDCDDSKFEEDPPGYPTKPTPPLMAPKFSASLDANCVLWNEIRKLSVKFKLK